MTTDDSPALGGQASDDAPMISSVQTRVIADARGAYLAGNLDALIGHLNAAQRVAFRQAVVRQSVHLLEPHVPEVPTEHGQVAGIQFAHEWLANPDGADVQRAMAYAAGEHIDGGVRYFDYDDIFLQPIWIIGATDLALAAREGVRVAMVTASWQPRGEDAPNPVEQAEAARRWQVEAAWAILRGQDVPALGDGNDE
jgi:hypothetical protein